MDSENQLLLKLIIQSLEKLDERLIEAGEKNFNAINDLDQKVNSIQITMARNTESLEEHMRRTELLEEQVKPLTSVYNGLLMVAKIISIVALLVTILGALFQAAKFLLGLH